MFHSTKQFNQDISGWDTSNVTDMISMFLLAKQFNKNISSWDTSNVTDMSYMLYGASSFNQDISSWNVNKVILHINFSVNSGIKDYKKLPKWNINHKTS